MFHVKHRLSPPDGVWVGTRCFGSDIGGACAQCRSAETASMFHVKHPANPTAAARTRGRSWRGIGDEGPWAIEPGKVERRNGLKVSRETSWRRLARRANVEQNGHSPTQRPPGVLEKFPMGRCTANRLLCARGKRSSTSTTSVYRRGRAGGKAQWLRATSRLRAFDCSVGEG